ncbi:predicted protein [Histoplasma mississippiense (nom. inval.)]|uniref:predicted protein n=1 Tax=Ajellomyces capsulatus (strain NAm1 / WU24) TaxID=2059318 RepID=UPI000157D03C|nr:predicted protein [Histoplasma mississippiense (nom. inval.)]EDN10823.1 predicted protein [Histoplasma mississippiense (nom. inval.)]
MAGLRKLFSIERTLFQSTNPELMESESNGPVSGTYSPCLALPRGSPEAKLPRLPQMQNQTFYGIERQFEDLHDQFCCHQSLSRQNKRFRNAEPTSSPHQIRRHVDVIEAGFPAQHARVPTPISPATVYQEDVADRNILLAAGNTRTLEIRRGGVSQCNLSNSRSASSLSYYQESRPRLWSRTQASGHRTPSGETRTELRVISSDHDLRSHPPSHQQEDAGASPPRRIGVRQYIALRLKNSSPALSSQESENIPPRPAPQPQLKIYKVAPDRQPSTRDAGESSRFNQSLVNPPKQLDVKPRNHDSKKATPKCPDGSKDGSHRLIIPRPQANLSREKCSRSFLLNTKLAAPHQKFCEGAYPTPLSWPPAGARREPNSSIAGIVNSPLPVATPSAVSPRTSSYNVEEIMRKEKQSLRLVGRNSFAKTRRNSYTSGKELSFPAIKGLEAGTEPDSSHQERRRRHTYSQPLPPSVPVAPEFPRELRQEAGKASLGRSGDSPQPKYTYKLIPDIRPKSSHSVRSKGPPSRLGKSGSSKQTQSCRPALVCQNSQSEMAQRTSSRNTPAEQTKPDLPKYQSDNPKNGERDTLPGLTNSSCTTPEPKIVTSSFPQQTSQKPPIKRLFSTSPQQIGRNRIPLRRSSIQKDLFDSGRFKL